MLQNEVGIKKYQRLHTFSNPPGFLQVLTYIISAMTTVTFYVCISKSLSQIQIASSSTLASLFSISLILMIIAAIYTGQVDPSDRLVQMTYQNGARKVTEYLEQKGSSSTVTELCHRCQSKTLNKSSKHCRLCDRCIQDFDHHCAYLNICVGGNNYKGFFITIVLVFINLSTYIITVSYFTFRLISQQAIYQYFISFIASWIVALFVLVALLGDTWLILLHIYLKYHNLTTYEWIQQGRQEIEQIKRVQEQNQKKQHQLKKQISSTEGQLKESLQNDIQKDYKKINMAGSLKFKHRNSQGKQNLLRQELESSSKQLIGSIGLLSKINSHGSTKISSRIDSANYISMESIIDKQKQSSQILPPKQQCPVSLAYYQKTPSSLSNKSPRSKSSQNQKSANVESLQQSNNKKTLSFNSNLNSNEEYSSIASPKTHEVELSRLGIVQNNKNFLKNESLIDSTIKRNNIDETAELPKTSSSSKIQKTVNNIINSASFGYLMGTNDMQNNSILKDKYYQESFKQMHKNFDQKQESAIFNDEAAYVQVPMVPLQQAPQTLNELNDSIILYKEVKRNKNSRLKKNYTQNLPRSTLHKKLSNLDSPNQEQKQLQKTEIVFIERNFAETSEQQMEKNRSSQKIKPFITISTPQYVNVNSTFTQMMINQGSLFTPSFSKSKK